MSEHETTQARLSKDTPKKPRKKMGLNEAAKTVRNHLEHVGTTESMLNEARGSGVPTLMRNGAERAATTLQRLVEAHEALKASLGTNVPEPMRDLLNRAELAELQLRTSIARIRMQAQELEGVAAGPLGQLPQGELQTSPEAVRRQAMENAPPGLCDDPLMEGTIACPLDDTLRATNRQLVEIRLEEMGEHWKAAIQNVHTEKRYTMVLERIGVTPLRDVLLSAGLGLIGGALAGFVLQKIGSTSVAQVALRDAALSLAQMKEAVTAVGKKGGEKLASKAPKPPAGDSVGDLTASLSQVAIDWTAAVTLAVRRLPDSALTALGAGLKSAPFSVAYFRERLELLMTRYSDVDKAIGREGWGGAQTTTAWVVHPRGANRMALVREEVEEELVGRGRERDFVVRRTGRFVFVQWVDRSLETAAMAIARQRKMQAPLTLLTTDARWVDASSPGLSEWRTNPDATDDVAMFPNGGAR